MIINFLQTMVLIALNLLAIASIFIGFFLMLMFSSFANAVCSHQVEMMKLQEEKARKDLGEPRKMEADTSEEVSNEA